MEVAVWIREQSSIVPTSANYFRDMVLEAMRDLEAELHAGEVDHAAYYFRMHSLKRMLR